MPLNHADQKVQEIPTRSNLVGHQFEGQNEIRAHAQTDQAITDRLLGGQCRGKLGNRNFPKTHATYAPFLH